VPPARATAVVGIGEGALMLSGTPSPREEDSFGGADDGALALACFAPRWWNVDGGDGADDRLAWLGLAWLGSDRLGSDRLGSDRLGSDRLGSDRLGSALGLALGSALGSALDSARDSAQKSSAAALTTAQSPSLSQMGLDMGDR
jgi:hypothetical protein